MKIAKLLLLTTAILGMTAKKSFASDCAYLSYKDEIASKKYIVLMKVINATKTAAVAEVLENLKGQTKKKIVIKTTWSFRMTDDSLNLESKQTVILATDNYSDSGKNLGIIEFRGPCENHTLSPKYDAELLKWLRSEEFKTYKPKTK